MAGFLNEIRQQIRDNTGNEPTLIPWDDRGVGSGGVGVAISTSRGTQGVCIAATDYTERGGVVLQPCQARKLALVLLELADEYDRREQ